MRVPRLRPPFPLGPPTWPKAVARPPVEKRTGVHYDTSWSRRYPARLARAVILDDILGPVVKALASPTVHGADHIEHLEAPVIFAANHHSHLDTPLVLTSLPGRFRHKAVVAAAADYFFTSPAKGIVSVLTIGAIPMERFRVNRRSADLAADLMGEGWNLVIFPEGGRSPDGWGRDFRGGAAYLALRCNRPVVPIHVEGTRRVLKKGARYPTPVGAPFGQGRGVQVTIGRPVYGRDGDDARRLAARIEAEVAALADEASSDWWSARRRAAAGTTPALSGPPVASWRRTWSLDEGRRRSGARPEWP
ncbi:MAG: lysophospholipid acyltransferase family protein [Acidimicrobiales bacterium]